MLSRWLRYNNETLPKDVFTSFNRQSTSVTVPGHCQLAAARYSVSDARMLSRCCIEATAESIPGWHRHNDVGNSSSLSNRQAARRGPGEPVPLSADEARPPRRSTAADSPSRRRRERTAAGGAAATRFRSSSVSDLRGAAGPPERRAADDGWLTGSIRGSRLGTVGRLAAVGIDLGPAGPARPTGGGDDDRRRAGSDGSFSGWEDHDADDEERCSDTVTVNEAVGDELSLGEDDFEYLPTNVQDSKLRRIADDLETLLNRQLMQPLVGDLPPYDHSSLSLHLR